jgi:hypothetical protein
VDGKMNGDRYPRLRLVDFEFQHGGLSPSSLLPKDTRPKTNLLAVRTDRDLRTDEWIYHFYPEAAKHLEADFRRASRANRGFKREKDAYEEEKAYKHWLNPYGINPDPYTDDY